MKNRAISITFAALLFIGVLPAQALPVSTNFGGFINFDNSNPFGASFGDSITGFASYDDAGLTNAAFETHALDTLNLSSLGFNFPLFNAPSLIGTFSSNNLIGVQLNDIVFDPGLTAHNFLMTGGPSFDIFGSIGPVLGGCLDFGTGVCNDPNGGPVTDVPEPGTLTLFALGLVGIWAGARQQQGRRLVDVKV